MFGISGGFLKTATPLRNTPTPAHTALAPSRYADVQFSATPAKYIKYTAGDITAIIEDDLFEGKVGEAAESDTSIQHALVEGRTSRPTSNTVLSLARTAVAALSVPVTCALSSLMDTCQDPIHHSAWPPQVMPTSRLDLMQQKMAAII